MDREACIQEGRDLLRSNPNLLQLVEFTRRYDPTDELRAAWGDRFQARRDYLMEKVRDMLYIGKEFPGSKEEVVFCMAYCVACAPYLGTSEERVSATLRGLLLELASSDS